MLSGKNQEYRVNFRFSLRKKDFNCNSFMRKLQVSHLVLFYFMFVTHRFDVGLKGGSL